MVIFEWNNKDRLAGLIIKREEVKVPIGMNAEECWSVKWRVKAEYYMKDLFFYCS